MLLTPISMLCVMNPMCDANDVMKAMLAMPFILDGLADKELNDFNALAQNSCARVRDSCSNMISAYKCICIGIWCTEQET